MDAQAHRSDHTELHRRLTVALDQIAAQQRQIDALAARIDMTNERIDRTLNAIGALTARVDALEGGADDSIYRGRTLTESRRPRPAAE